MVDSVVAGSDAFRHGIDFGDKDVGQCEPSGVARVVSYGPKVVSDSPNVSIGDRNELSATGRSTAPACEPPHQVAPDSPSHRC